MASNVGGNIMPDAGPSAAPTAQVEIAQPTTGAKKKDPPKDLESECTFYPRYRR